MGHNKGNAKRILSKGKITMTQMQLDEAITNQYDNGRYMPLGTDSGALKFIRVVINETAYSASITLDSEIAKIRRIWALSKITDSKYKHIYDYTKQYYSARV
jgi:hypothetical protein